MVTTFLTDKDAIVRYDEQTLTEEQKAQARANIGAAESEKTSYTNVLPFAVDIDGTTIYNGVGYKTNTRMSGSSGQFTDNTGSCCTGYIKTPVGEAFTVCLKNIVNSTENNYGCHFYFFDSVGTAISNSCDYSNAESYGYSPVFDTDGNIIQITVPAGSGGEYMVISAVTIDATSIITVNEPIE